MTDHVQCPGWGVDGHICPECDPEMFEHASSNRVDDFVWATVKCSGGEIVHVKVPWSAVIEAREADKHGRAIPNRAAERFKVETAPDGMPAIVEQRQDATRNRVEDIAFTISQGIIGWADEDKTGERYPIPPWTVYVAIAKDILGE